MPTEHGRERDIDAIFDDIVAHWDEPAAEPRRALPRIVTQAGPLPLPEQGHDDGTLSPSGTHIPRVPDVGTPQRYFGARGYTVPDEPDDFVPSVPAPLPAAKADPEFWAVVGCLVLGPLVVLGVVLTGRSAGWLLALGILLTLVGVGLAVARGGREPRDPFDDGARV